MAQNPGMETITIDANAPLIRSRITGKKCSAPAAPSSPCATTIATISAKSNASPDFEYVRFHAILQDEVGLYDEDSTAIPSTIFPTSIRSTTACSPTGVRPFIELSFMPKKLAALEALHAFWYQPNVSPPKD